MTDGPSPISISQVALGTEAEQLVLDVLRSGRLAQGPMVERLEAGFCNIADTSHAIAVNSGTTALVAAIEALDIGPGDEVITSPFTFVATLNAILEAGATARFVDIGSDFCIRPDLIGAEINDRTRAIMPVHLYGLAADMDPIVATADAADLAIIEDAAQSHGATYGGRPVGGFGIGCFSLYATKNLTTGEGGIVTTNDDAIADRLRVLRNQGMRARYDYVVAGHNWRLTELQAAIGIPQLATLDQATVTRRANAEALTDGLDGVEGLILPCPHEGRGHVWHQYTVRVGPAAPITRDDLAARLTEAGIGNGVYYPRVVFDYDCYRDHPQVLAAEVPEAFAVAREVLSLPVHPGLDSSDIGRIVATVRAAFDE